MKKTLKTLFLSILFLSVGATAQAQFKLGITAGLNISQVKVDDGDYKQFVDKVRPGFIVGPTAIFTIPKTGLGFDASALFDLRGAKSKSNNDSESVSCTTLQIPVNIRYGVLFGDMVYGFVFTGPQFGFDLGSKESLFAKRTVEATGNRQEMRWVHQSSTFSWNLGIGGVVMEKLQVRVSYNLALRKTGEIQRVDLDDPSGTKVLTEGKSHACQIALSYLF